CEEHARHQATPPDPAGHCWALVGQAAFEWPSRTAAPELPRRHRGTSSSPPDRLPVDMGERTALGDVPGSRWNACTALAHSGSAWSRVRSREILGVRSVPMTRSYQIIPDWFGWSSWAHTPLGASLTAACVPLRATAWRDGAPLVPAPDLRRTEAQQFNPRRY